MQNLNPFLCLKKPVPTTIPTTEDGFQPKIQNPALNDENRFYCDTSSDNILPRNKGYFRYP